MIENNLIDYHDETQTFITTEKGLNFLKMHNEIIELFNSLLQEPIMII